jgi:inhibitor of cysteine peptidase
MFTEMMMKKIYFLLLVTALLISCATLSPTASPTSLPNPTAEEPNVLPDATDPSQPITVKAGETFDIVLSSNPTTGYRWNLIGDLDANVVQLIGQDYISQQPVLVGSGGVDVWTFRAINAADATIVLGYYPPGNETEPDKTVTFSIQVQ